MSAHERHTTRVSSPADRAAFVIDNAVALVEWLEARIDRLRAEIRKLNRRDQDHRLEIKRLQGELGERQRR